MSFAKQALDVYFRDFKSKGGETHKLAQPLEDI